MEAELHRAKQTASGQKLCLRFLLVRGYCGAVRPSQTAARFPTALQAGWQTVSSSSAHFSLPRTETNVQPLTGEWERFITEQIDFLLSEQLDGRM